MKNLMGSSEQSQFPPVFGLKDINYDMSKEINQSWDCLKQKNINPDLTTLPPPKLSQALNIYDAKWKHNYPIIKFHAKSFEEYLNQTSSVFFTLDLNLTIVFQMGSRELLNKLQSRNISLGARLSEEIVGPNAAALSLKYDDVICVLGEGHYTKVFHQYVCSAFAYPSDREKHKGCFMIVSPIVEFNYSHLTMLRNWTYLSSNTIKLFKHEIELDLSREYHKSNYPKVVEGLIFVDYRGVILRINELLLNMNLCPVDYCGKKLSDVFPELLFTLDCIKSGEIIKLKEVYLFSQSKIFFVKCYPVFKNDNPIGIIIYLGTNKQVQKKLPQYWNFQAQYTFDDLLGENESFLQVKEEAKSASDIPSNILITGENGTGKELFAQSIHNESSRADKPFVAMNCAAIPRELIVSELFGYEKGAFTGARTEGAPGKFEIADGGTIFLDEIGDMPIEIQSVLLRTIEEKTICRIGGGNPVPIDIKVITATNRNLMDLINDNRFRLDLYYRINVINIEIPPLRERKEDIIMLAYYFLKNLSEVFKKNIIGITPCAVKLLINHSWPGNVRELRNIIERSVNRCSSSYINENDLPKELLSNSYIPNNEMRNLGQGLVFSPEQFKAMEKKQIFDLMLKYNGNKTSVAKELGLSRVTLYKKLNEFKINDNDLIDP